MGEASEDEQFYTVKEVACKLRVSNMTIYRMVKEGELEALKVRGSVRIARSAFSEYCRRRGIRVQCLG